MKRLDILAAFETEIDKIDDAINKPVTDDSLYWLNQAVAKFVKERFNGNAPHFTSYELNEKRTKDLHRLKVSNIVIEEDVLQDPDTNYTWYMAVPYLDNSLFDALFYTWPEDLLYILSEGVDVVDNATYSNVYNTSVFECTADNFMYRITNSLTDFHYRHHKARPLRVRIGEKQSSDGIQQEVMLLNDKNYHVLTYWISYLRRPEKLTDENPDDDEKEYSDFEDSVWYEIIKIAAQMYIENKAEPRYRTLTNEVLTQE